MSTHPRLQTTGMTFTFRDTEPQFFPVLAPHLDVPSVQTDEDLGVELRGENNVCRSPDRLVVGSFTRS